MLCTHHPRYLAQARVAARQPLLTVHIVLTKLKLSFLTIAKFHISCNRLKYLNLKNFLIFAKFT